MGKKYILWLRKFYFHQMTPFYRSFLVLMNCYDYYQATLAVSGKKGVGGKGTVQKRLRTSNFLLVLAYINLDSTPNNEIWIKTFCSHNFFFGCHGEKFTIPNFIHFVGYARSSQSRCVCGRGGGIITQTFPNSVKMTFYLRTETTIIYLRWHSTNARQKTGVT